MGFYENFLEMIFWNNTGEDYLIALGIFIGIFLILKLITLGTRKVQCGKSKCKGKSFQRLLINFVSVFNWKFCLFLSFIISLYYLNIPQLLERILFYLVVILVVYYVAKGFSRVVDYFTNCQIEKRKKEGKDVNASILKTFGTIFKVAIYSIALLMILSNFGVEITPLIASIGIAGIAIALALQAVLSDLFSAFAIYFDKPFKEGEFIIVGNDLGIVKNVGIKTTRLQTLQGQELSISNTDLTNSRVNNYSRMERRRIVFGIGVTYDTPSKKLKKANEIIKKAIDSTDKATLDRVHFKEFGSHSLNFEIAYYVESPDYKIYMDTQQKINLKIKEMFEKEKIEFAFPTQTIHLEKLE